MGQYHPLTELNLKEGDEVFFFNPQEKEIPCSIIRKGWGLVAHGNGISQVVGTSRRSLWRRAERQPVKMEDFL